jgi:DNA-binding GntR family transcriptional regulator
LTLGSGARIQEYQSRNRGKECLVKLARPLPVASRSVLADHAYETLRDALFTGAFAPDDPLRETELARMIGVSRTPVREALRRLELERLVVRTANGGLAASPLTPELIRNTFEVRKLLEGYAAREAARHATPRSLRVLYDLIDEAELAVRLGHQELLPDLNDRFHGHVEILAKNEVLSRIGHLLREQTVAYRAFALGQPRQQRGFVDDHRKILEALASHDTAHAEALAIDHLEQAVSALLDESRTGSE